MLIPDQLRCDLSVEFVVVFLALSVHKPASLELWLAREGMWVAKGLFVFTMRWEDGKVI